MKKTTKIALMIAGSLVLVGCALFVGVMATLGWDFTKLSTVQYETNTYEIGEPFHDISVATDTADITLALSDDGTCRVECYEEKNAKHTVSVEKDALVIQRNDEKKPWYGYIGLHFDSPKITVYLPSTEYHALSVKADTGNIRVAHTSVGALDLSVTTGKVTVSDVTCESLTSSGSTGNVILSNVIAEKEFSIKRSTGNVKFDGCDAAELHVKTSTGNVTGSLLTDKVFLTEVSTGKVTVPQTTTGGTCEIKTNTGNITIEIN